MSGRVVSARVGDAAHYYDHPGPGGIPGIRGIPGDDVAIRRELSFKSFADSVGAIASSMTNALRAAKPDEAEVEFSVGVDLRAGQLTALIVQGGDTATMRVKLTWRAADEPPDLTPGGAVKVESARRRSYALISMGFPTERDPSSFLERSHLRTCH